jgi:hypothetical protein
LRYPNLRYGNPTEMAYYAMDISIPDLARMLRRSERTVKDWLSGAARVPWWVPELMRLRRQEGTAMLRQMGFTKIETKLGLVRADVLQLAQRRPPAAIAETDLVRDDFDVQPRQGAA